MTQFTWREKARHVDRTKLIKQIKQIFENGLPSDATRHKNWCVLIGNQQISPKWLFHLITGADYSDFNAITARAKLNQVGFLSMPVDKKMTGKADFPDSNDKDIRDEFLLRVGDLVREMLPDRYANIIPKHSAGKNYIQFYYPEFPRSHYELVLSREEMKFDFHFEGTRELNLSRLGWIKSHIEAINQQFMHEVHADRWGKNWAYLSARLGYLEIEFMLSTLQFKQDYSSSENLINDDSLLSWVVADLLSKNSGTEIKSIEKEHFVATIMVQLICSSYNYIAEAFKAFPGLTKRRRSKSSTNLVDDKVDIYRRVDEQIGQIQQFLAGRLSLRPSDEQLCDWIQFCYQVGLFKEGMKLFDYIHEQNLDNDWLYKRTKKYAQACRLNTGSDK